MNSFFSATDVVQNTANQVTGQSVTGTTAATTLASFGMSAIQLHDFHLRLQAAMMITIPWTVVEGWVTVGDAQTYLNAELNDPAAE